MIKSVMMAALIGATCRTPKSSSGMSKKSAASGPYAAELSPSKPKMGIRARGRFVRSAFVGRFDGFANEQVEDIHGRLGPS